MHLHPQHTLLAFCRFVSFFIFIVLSASFTQAGEWYSQGEEGFSVKTVRDIALALDSKGMPYVAYTDASQNDKATVMRFNGASWEAVGKAGFTTNKAYSFAIALDSNDTPYIAFQDHANAARATVMKFSSKTWNVVDNAGFSAGKAEYLALIFDSNDVPYVGFRDNGANNKARVIKLNSKGRWENVGMAGISNGAVEYVSLAMASNNAPYIAYRDIGNGSKLTVGRWTGSGWDHVGGLGVSSGSVRYVSLVLDANDKPYVAYKDEKNGSRLTVGHYFKKGWSALGGVGITKKAVEHVALTLDSDGNPYVAYQDHNNSKRISVIRWKNDKWEYVAAEGFSAGEVSYVNLKLDRNNTPYVAYQDIKKSKKVVVKYMSESMTPSSPQNVAATIGGTNQVAISWDPPALQGASAITGYQVTTIPGNRSCNAVADQKSCIINGLTNGVTYTFSVVAINAQGNSPATTVSATPTYLNIPNAPSSVKGTPGNGQVTVSWKTPSNTGGSQLTGYTVTASPSNKTCSPSPATATTCSISGLTNGTRYTFSVIASNAQGNSPAATVRVTPSAIITVPEAPANVTTVAGNRQVIFSWDPPESDGGSTIIGYKVALSVGTNTCTPSPATATTCTMLGLTNGKTYAFNIVAINAKGSSLAAIVNATPTATPGAPSAPTELTAQADNGQVTIGWAAPTQIGSSPITGYQVTAAPGGQSCSSASANDTSCTVAALTNGTAYTFSVVAINMQGSSTAATIQARPTATPGILPPAAPRETSAEIGDTQITLRWQAPVNDGGSPITGYRVTATPGGRSCTPSPATATQCTVTGLINGTLYTFAITATNIAGTGEAAMISGSPILLTEPAEPTAVSGTPAHGQVTLSWLAPTDTGGSPITGYRVTTSPGSASCQPSPATATSCTITGLINDTSYTFSVIAQNAQGNSTAATATLVPSAMPKVADAPLQLSAKAQSERVILNWIIPASNGGSPITGYQVTTLPGGASCTLSSPYDSSCVMSGLTNGTVYAFSVVAINRQGNSLPATVTATPDISVPDTPRQVITRAGDGEITVSWTAPVYHGGTPITSYQVTAFPSGESCHTDASGSYCKILGLTNDTLYRLNVVAINAKGASRAASISATPKKTETIPALSPAGIVLLMLGISLSLSYRRHK